MRSKLILLGIFLLAQCQLFESFAIRFEPGEQGAEIDVNEEYLLVLPKQEVSKVLFHIFQVHATEGSLFSAC